MKDKHKVSARASGFISRDVFWKMKRKETQENVSLAVNICFTRFRASSEVLLNLWSCKFCKILAVLKLKGEKVGKFEMGRERVD